MQVYGERLKRVMRHLLGYESGASLEELALAPRVTPTAGREQPAALGLEVDACTALGGYVCRFRFTPR